MMDATNRAQPDIALAERVFDELRRRTGDGKGVTRVSYGTGEQIAHDIVGHEAKTLGLAVTADAACNLYLTHRGTAPGPAIIIGSHLDSVPVGGNFDGAAGVIMGLSVVAGFRKAGIRAPRDVTIMAIRAEESTWFAASYIGSRAAFGKLTAEEMATVRRSSDQLTLAAAIRAAGGDPDALHGDRSFLDPGQIHAFIEPHIEQGPALDTSGVALGVVTGIRGSFRYRAARCLGAYAHSGATPRNARRDAVRAVAALIVSLDTRWAELERQHHDLTVTFGQVSTESDQHAFSKVAGRVDFSLDVRSESPQTLALVQSELAAQLTTIERDHNVQFDLGPMTDSDPALMDDKVVAALACACAETGTPAVRMASGAGHDAAVFARMGVPSGMLFVRNQNGSHNPAETMEMRDFAAAARAMSHFCLSPILA